MGVVSSQFVTSKGLMSKCAVATPEKLPYPMTVSVPASLPTPVLPAKVP